METDFAGGHPLSRRQRVNVALIMLVSHALQVLVVTAAVAAAFVVFTFKDDFHALGERLLAAVRGGDAEQTAPGETRIRLAPDGHYWVNAQVNGATVRFLIDSGATMTSMSKDTADRVGIRAGDGFSVASEGRAVGAADPGAMVLVRLASGSVVNGTLRADRRVELPH